jgi:glycerol-3-phosphate cytidylyltransferase
MIKGFYPIVGDILHAGHIEAIREAKENCNYLIVAMNCTPDNKSPIQSISERYIQLNAVKYIDELIVYEGREDLEELIKLIRYDIRFLGEDYIGKDYDGKETEQELGIKNYYLRRKHNLSSTELKNRLR